RPESFADAQSAGQTAGATEVEGLPDTSSGAQVVPGDGPGAAAERSRAIRALVESSAVPRAVATEGARLTRTTLEVPESIVFRGEALPLRGRVTDAAGQPVAQGEVRVLLLAGEERRAIR